MSKIDIYAVVADGLKITRREAKKLVLEQVFSDPEAEPNVVLETAIKLFPTYFAEWVKPMPLDAMYIQRKTPEEEREELIKVIIEVAKSLVINSRKGFV